MAIPVMTDSGPTTQASTSVPAAGRRAEPSVRDIIEAAHSAPAPARGTIVCSLLTTVMLWASFTPLDQGWLAWLALVPLFQLVRLQRPTRWMYRLTYLGGLAWALPTLQWMRLGDPLMYPAWIALSAYLAMYFPVAIGISRVAVHRFNIPMTLAVPVVWTGLEYLRSVLMTGFSWYFIGHTQHAWPELIQVSDLVGAYGVSFLVVMASASLAGLVPTTWLRTLRLFPPAQVPAEFSHLPADGMQPACAQAVSMQRPVLQAAVVIALLGAAVGYGMVRRGQAEFVDGPRVALIQGDFPTTLKHDPQEYPRIFRTHDALTGVAVRYQPDLVVWPESMFRWPLQEAAPGLTDTQLLAMAPPVDSTLQYKWVDSWRNSAVKQTLHEMSERAGAAMIIGIETWQADPDGINAYGSAAFVTPSSGVVGRYDKIHRVIFGEYVPLKDSLPILTAFNPIAAGGIEQGESGRVFQYRGWNFAPIICFEDTVPELVRGISAGSADPVDVFVNITNDGWFRGSSEVEQHLITARFRAIETRTPIVRAVNTGISAIVDGDGLIREPEVFINGDAETVEDSITTMHDPATGRLRKSLNAAIVSPVPLDNRDSVYVRCGDWFAQTCAFAVIGLALCGLFRRLS